MATQKPKTLAGLVGVSCAGLLCVIVPKFEGTKYVGYRDIIGVPTKCMGDTNNVVVGRRYTTTECQQSLINQLIIHSEPVLKCTPILKGHDYQLASAVSFAYNIGGGGYCHSSVAKKFNQHDFNGACNAMMLWVYAGGHKQQGLINRREQEVKLCKTGL
jgi:lysozyme